MKLIFIVALYILILNRTYANTICITRQVCNLIYSFNLSESQNDNIKPIIFKSKDPHNHHLTSFQIKQINNASLVITPPHFKEIQSLLEINTKIISLKNINQHFWLNHKEICIALNQLKKIFKTTLKNQKIKNRCLKTSLNLNAKIALNLKARKIKTIILSHHSLTKNFQKDFKVMSLSSEHGHTNLNISNLKFILRSLKKNNILFIEEEQIPLPVLNFYNLLNDTNHIKVNTLGKLQMTDSNPFSVLLLLERLTRQ